MAVSFFFKESDFLEDSSKLLPEAALETWCIMDRTLNSSSSDDDWFAMVCVYNLTCSWVMI
jgi:hypothetical protein